jgi:hypothetical protein
MTNLTIQDLTPAASELSTTATIDLTQAELVNIVGGSGKYECGEKEEKKEKKEKKEKYEYGCGYKYEYECD